MNCCALYMWKHLKEMAGLQCRGSTLEMCVTEGRNEVGMLVCEGDSRDEIISNCFLAILRYRFIPDVYVQQE